MTDIKAIDKEYVANTYARFPMQLVSGKGSVLLDENGKEFDRFSIDPQGKVTELFQSPELKHFSLSRQ